jgi:hypothetical protein
MIKIGQRWHRHTYYSNIIVEVVGFTSNKTVDTIILQVVKPHLSYKVGDKEDWAFIPKDVYEDGDWTYLVGQDKTIC